MAVVGSAKAREGRRDGGGKCRKKMTEKAPKMSFHTLELLLVPHHDHEHDAPHLLLVFRSTVDRNAAPAFHDFAKSEREKNKHNKTIGSSQEAHGIEPLST